MSKWVSLLLALALVGALSAGVRLASILDQARYRDDVVEELTYFPSGRFLKLADLGFDSLIADAMWFRGIQYYGAHRRTDKAYPLAEHVFSTITDLDPQFIDAYRFGGLVLADDVGVPAAAVSLLRKGMRNNPEDWRLPFDIGFLYFVDLNDYVKAAHYFRLASYSKDSPEIAKRFTAFAFSKAGKTEVGRALWEEMYRSSQNRLVRETAEAAIKNIDLDTTAERLAALVAKFRSARGKSPSGLSDLVKAGLVRKIPQDPFGGSYFLEARTDRVLSTTRVLEQAERTANRVKRAVRRYNGRTGHLPQSLADLTNEGLLEAIPEIPGVRLTYDAASGYVTYELAQKEVLQ